MNLRRPAADGRLSYYDIIGPLWLFRSFELVLGVAICALAAVVVGDVSVLYVPAAFFLLRGGIGLGMIRSVTVDRDHRTVSVRRGFLFPMWGSDHPLEEFGTVEITVEVRRWMGSRATACVYLVRLLGYRDREVCVGAAGGYLEARARAEAVAGYLGLGILDAAAQGDPVRIPARHVGKTLRQQILEARPPVSCGRGSATAVAEAPGAGRSTDVLILPPRPARMRLTCRVDGSRLVLEIPKWPWWRLALTPVCLFLVFGGGALIAFGVVALFVEHRFDWDSHLRPALGWTLAAGGFGAVVGLCHALAEGFTRYRIEAHPGGLTVRRRGLLFGITRELPVEVLTELRVTPDGLQAIGRDRVVTFGSRQLRADEKGWLREAIARAIAA
jgi:hypothetical protein